MRARVEVSCKRVHAEGQKDMLSASGKNANHLAEENQL